MISPIAKINAAYQLLFFQDRRVFCLGFLQSFFESAMYIFVFCWTPSLHTAAKYYKTIEHNDHNHIIIDPGWIFADFMTACLIGTILSNIFTKEYHVCNDTLSICINIIASLTMLFVCIFNEKYPNTDTIIEYLGGLENILTLCVNNPNASSNAILMQNIDLLANNEAKQQCEQNNDDNNINGDNDKGGKLDTIDNSSGNLSFNKSSSFVSRLSSIVKSNSSYVNNNNNNGNDSNINGNNNNSDCIKVMHITEFDKNKLVLNVDGRNNLYFYLLPENIAEYIL